MSPVQRLRRATAPLHDSVDAAFGGHDLTDRNAYGAFLLAHARALPAVEAVLAVRPGLPDWPERTSLLRQDLTDLALAMPAALPFLLPDASGADWGALYVVEGSRLGGVMLARQVPDTLPARYLSARHAPGAWRALLTAIDSRGADDPIWLDGLLAGAEATFALYARAAG